MSRRSAEDEGGESQQGESDFDSLLREVARVGDAVASPPLPQPGQIIGAKYRIEERIGRGGMGAVFRATHVVSQKAVAVKWMLRSASDEHAHRRFLREARVAGRIDHPNVVNVFDLGQEGECGYLVMELLHGEALRARLERGPLQVAEAVDMLLPAMRGVAAVHRAGVIHRDLKPDNIFLCEGPDGTPREAKVLDFGVSAMTATDPTDPTLTKDGAVLGTPSYMSPEQLQSVRDIDARADVYSFGVILYETLTGKLPFDADSYPALVLAIVHGQPKPPTEVRSGLPREVERIVLRAIAKSREERYASIESLIAALAPFGSARGADSGDGVPSRANAPDARPRKWGIVAGVFAVLGCVAWLLWDRGAVPNRGEKQPAVAASGLKPQATAAVLPPARPASPPRAAPASAANVAAPAPIDKPSGETEPRARRAPGASAAPKVRQVQVAPEPRVSRAALRHDLARRALSISTHKELSTMVLWTRLSSQAPSWFTTTDVVTSFRCLRSMPSMSVKRLSAVVSVTTATSSVRNRTELSSGVKVTSSRNEVETSSRVPTAASRPRLQKPSRTDQLEILGRKVGRIVEGVRDLQIAKPCHGHANPFRALVLRGVSTHVGEVVHHAALDGVRNLADERVLRVLERPLTFARDDDEGAAHVAERAPPSGRLAGHRHDRDVAAREAHDHIVEVDVHGAQGARMVFFRRLDRLRLPPRPPAVGVDEIPVLGREILRALERVRIERIVERADGVRGFTLRAVDRPDGSVVRAAARDADSQNRKHRELVFPESSS